MKISSFRRYYVYHWYSQFTFVFCPRKWQCSTWWPGQWTHLETRGSPQRNGGTHMCIVCTSWYREVSDGARPRLCLPRGRSWALCLGHSCQNRMCSQLPPGSCEEQRLHWGRCCLCTHDGIRREMEMQEELFWSRPSLSCFKGSREAVRRNIPIPYGCLL